MLSKEAPVWRRIQRRNFTSIGDLADYLLLDPFQRAQLAERGHFPLNLPRRLAEKIQKGSLDDPLFRQYVPVEQEALVSEGYVADPVSDTSFQKSSRLLQKYRGRALLITSGACAMHCRYCFRQNYAYGEKADFTEEVQLLRNDSSIHEIILSGGDPLSLSDRRLATLCQQFSEIPHLKRLRFHTRFPVGIPERIDDSFLALLEQQTLQVWFVIHCNHPRELDVDVLAALKRVQRLGIPVMNQAVLLRGVNDRVDVLQELCSTLVDHGIQPYYLHQLDRVQGAAHFEVPEERGRQLQQELAARLSGYGVPRYVREVPGELGKSPL